jgi:uncharacterized protein YbjT (DUF2867 family)
MRIVVAGATGSTGKKVLEQARAAGHDVVAFARHPQAIPAQDRVDVVAGDVLEPRSIIAAITGSDAVICTIGPPNNRRPGTLISTAVRNLVAACQTTGVNRFVFESGLMVSDGHELSPAGRLAIKMYGQVYHRLRADKHNAEATIIASPLDWVIIRPPTLKHTPATGDSIAGPSAPISPTKAISYADCAAALVKATAETAWIHHVINVGRH